MSKLPLIRLDQASVVFEGVNSDVKAIEDISFDINKGDFIVLVGPSGCGKSTLLNIIAGFIKPSSGKCLMADQEITGPSRHRGVVFQNSALYPWMSVAENIGYGLKLNQEKDQDIEKQVKQYLEIIELKDRADNYPFELSGGQRQRVALARSLINNPDVLLLDEPFGALDALTKINMQQFLKDLWQDSGGTFFMITHDIDEALKLATRILVMSSSPGKIIREFDLNNSQDRDDAAIKNEILSLIG